MYGELQCNQDQSGTTIPSPLLSYAIISVVLAWWAIATMQHAHAVSISAQLTDCMQDRSYLKHRIYYY